MTSSAQIPPVVVGVDGSPGSVAALRYAVREARRLDAPLRLVHVVPDHVPMTAVMPASPEELAEAGRAQLRQAVDHVSAIDPSVEVTADLCRGPRSGELARSAADGRLLVVGRDSRPRLERLARGDTTSGASTRAEVPTVAVPADWQPREQGVVLVGLRRSAHNDALLGAAFDLAAARGARLVALHAWTLATDHDEGGAGQTEAAAWAKQASREIGRLLEPWRETYPEVRVQARVVRDRPLPALLAASKRADELVMVRRAHGVPAAVHLGGTARSALHLAACPVRIVPPDLLGDELAGLALEAAGEMLR